jgi:hypothetical protein
VGAAFSRDKSLAPPLISVIPESAGGGYPWFDRPFDRLTVLSKVEGLTTLSEVEGESRLQIHN